MEIYNIFAAIFMIAQKWQHIADKQIYPRIKITLKQWLLIVIIESKFRDYPPTISEAAAAYGSSHQNIKKMALALQRQKHLLVTTDPEDRRIQRLALTGKHRRFFEGESNKKWQADFVSGFFAGLHEKEIRELNRMVMVILGRIQAIETGEDKNR